MASCPPFFRLAPGSRPSWAGLHEAVEGSALKLGLSVDPALTDRLVTDTGTGDALPVLAFTLREWPTRTHPTASTLIGRGASADLGGVEAAREYDIAGAMAFFSRHLRFRRRAGTSPWWETMIADDEDFEILDRASCLELLATVQVGRLAWVTPDSLVNIRPVNYTLAGADVVVRTGMGSILAAAQGNLPVTFEADDLEPCLRAGWSVLVIGTAESLGSTSEAARLRASVHPWARGTRENVLRIRAGEITGRRPHPQTGTVTVVHLGSDAEG